MTEEMAVNPLRGAVRIWRSLWPKRSRESTLTLLKRLAVERGLDPDYFDQLANLPSEPGSLGPGDPGEIHITGTEWICSGHPIVMTYPFSEWPSIPEARLHFHTSDDRDKAPCDKWPWSNLDASS